LPPSAFTTLPVSAPGDPTTDVGLSDAALSVEAGAQQVKLLLADVAGVARRVPLVPIPDAALPVIGLANVRGALVTVLQLERLLAPDVTAVPVTTEAQSIVLLHAWDGRVAFAVDRCGAVGPRGDHAVLDVTTLVTPWLAPERDETEVDR
jgi:purine-binding chemotaxis protein CheW